MADLHQDYWTRQGLAYETTHRAFQGTERAFFRKQEHALVSFLQKLKFDSVLEFGCGFGRITRTLCDTIAPKRYDAFDLSEAQVASARKLCRNVSFTVETLQDYQPAELHDLVLGVEVLLHVPPDEIEQMLARLASWTGKYLVHIDQYPPQSGEAYELLPTKSGHWTGRRCAFSYYHNFPLLHAMGLRKVEVVPIGKRQALFCWRRSD